ncbi:MAG TPA: exodeoxyribonuclease V subunit gamma [Flavitalea sp.]|nr:exodeoxyribonuclease V subunit gamma [Flavitalea sp.]
MSFQLYSSNQLESLSGELMNRLVKRQTSVFQPDYVVTQTDGMGNWLKYQVATNSKNRIAANISFVTPNGLVEKVYHLLGGLYQNSFSSRNLSWLVFAVLGEQEFIDRFPFIAGYYEAASSEKDVKRLALAQKLADFFDQYQIYRPDLIDGWNNQQAVTLFDEDWQQYIWNRAKKLANDQLADKTIQWKSIKEQLQNPDNTTVLKEQFPEIHIFGISILAPYHLQILTAMAEHIDINFFLLNPAPSVYWYDTINEKLVATLTSRGVASRDELVTGNSLLTGWGRVLKETFALLFEHDELLNAYTDSGSIEPEPDTLLHRIQYDIFNNLNNDERGPIAGNMISDGSITINSCYTVAREVECLYNYLVHLVDKRKETLAPRDIVVMVTDIDAYAPYIKAVFDNALYRFPYSISDESFDGSDNMVSALQEVLGISEENFTAENILQLLESSYIRTRFNITNLTLLRHAVDAANIRFGIDGDKEDDTVYVSWKYGLQRILFGLCISNESEYVPPGSEDSLFPLDIAEGSDSLELVRFVHFVEMIIDSIQRRAAPRTISGWVEYVTWVLHNLVYEAEEQLEEDYNVLLKQLNIYHEVEQIVSGPVSFSVFRHHMSGSLSASRKTASFIRGGVTFCSLIPMRSIPFKVIAMLGLNFDKFPRRETRSGFDLMQREHRRGDRNVKENDKHLFLETVLSAKDYLYISYIGQSAKDNESLPPSAIVDELVDYIETAADDVTVRNKLIKRHPLHGFSSLYNNSSDLTLYTYLGTSRDLSHHLFDLDKPRPGFSFEEVSLDSLARFFRNPFKFYYNTVLDIRYDEDESLLPETELFELNKLQEWDLREQMLRESEDTMQVQKNRMLKTGLLPLKNMAPIKFNELAEQVDKLRMLLAAHGFGPDFTQANIELQIGTTLISGTIPLVQGTRMVMFTFSKRDIKHFLTAYIRFLAGVAAGKIEEVYFISGETESVYQGVPMQKEDAQRRLQELLLLYKEGHQRILPFFVDLQQVPKDVPKLTAESFSELVAQKRLNSYAMPFDDLYVLNEMDRSWVHSKETGEEFISLCKVLISPLGALFPDAKFNGK